MQCVGMVILTAPVQPTKQVTQSASSSKYTQRGKQQAVGNGELQLFQTEQKCMSKKRCVAMCWLGDC